MHALRKVRNKAVHENYSESSDCPVFLQMAYSLSEWFMQTYSDFAPRKWSIAVPRSMSRTKLEVDALALQTFSKALNAYAKDEKKNLQNLSICAKKLRVYKKVNELMSVLLGG